MKPTPAELGRLARWYSGIAIDWIVAAKRPGATLYYHKVTSAKAAARKALLLQRRSRQATSQGG